MGLDIRNINQASVVPGAPNATFAIEAEAIWIGLLWLPLSKWVYEDASVRESAILVVIRMYVIYQRVRKVPVCSLARLMTRRLHFIVHSLPVNTPPKAI
jgi:hypothetical protein